MNWKVSPSAQTISGSGCDAGIRSVQEVSPEEEDSGRESIREFVRFRRIMRAAFNTMRVNQVVKADRPSKLRKWRYPDTNAFWTASSASSLFRKMAWAMATNFRR